MPGESFTIVTDAGSGKRQHSWQRTVASLNVEDNFVIPGEYPLPSYTVQVGGVSIATLSDHVLQIMAGTSLNVRIRKITLQQAASATAAASFTCLVLRLTGAGSGGTPATPAKVDTGDAAAGATAQTLPTAKGAESTELLRRRMGLLQTVPTGGYQVPGWEWVQHPGMKPLIVPAGTSNGIALKAGSSHAGATVDVYVEFVETAYL